MSESVKTATVSRFSIEGSQPVEYYMYFPASGHSDTRLMISIHGISRNAKEHLKGFADQAERDKVTMIAPIFPASDFHRYQRLGVSSREGRADQAFDQILQDVNHRFGINPFPLHIFGFSGGGQFAHRYAMFYPNRIARLVLAAPGWFTFPDPTKPYPYGLRSTSNWPKLKLLPSKFLKIPTLVVVGEKDDIRDEDLNKSRRIDAHQGLNRMERGRRWVNTYRALARAHNVSAEFQFAIVPNASHAYESYLADPEFSGQVFSFLFPNIL